MIVDPQLLSTAAWTIGGIAAGASASWAITRHYYIRASRERPEWAEQVVEELKQMTDRDPGDLVAILEEAAREHDIVLDGGKF